MSSPALATVSLPPGSLAEALELLPAGPGVGQILAADGGNLVLAPASNLRRWAAQHLGLAANKPRKPGQRPKTDLSSIAGSVRFVETLGPFQQRLTYERLMAPLVPLGQRRDLKPPAFLHLDPEQRFPRLSVAGLADADASQLFGPFRDRRAAEKARDAVQRLFPLRPCDLRFEPAEDLPAGIACIFAQVRSCAAPCLRRVGEQDYRDLAARVAAWLGDPGSRPEAPAAVPSTVAAASSMRALVVDPGRREIGLFPVLGGRVLESAARRCRLEQLPEALAALDWPPAEGPSDWPWLVAWMRSPKARACFLVQGGALGPQALETRVRAALEAAARPHPGGKVDRTRRGD